MFLLTCLLFPKLYNLVLPIRRCWLCLTVSPMYTIVEKNMCAKQTLPPPRIERGTLALLGRETVQVLRCYH